MTTTQTDPYAEAHQALDVLDTLTAAGLAQPFIDWVDHLSDLHYNVNAVIERACFDPTVYERAKRLRAMLSEAGEIVEAAAMNNIFAGGDYAWAGVRTFFDHLTNAANLRGELALITTPPTEQESEQFRQGFQTPGFGLIQRT